MSVTLTRWQLAARVGKWGLDVDDRADPSQWIVLAYPPENTDKRHSEPCDVVLRLAYQDIDDAFAEEPSRQTTMPLGIARQLLNQVGAKRASYRARRTA